MIKRTQRSTMTAVTKIKIKRKPKRFSIGLKLVKPAEENSFTEIYSSVVLFEIDPNISFFKNHSLISSVGKMSNSAIFLIASIYISSSAGKSTL